MNNRKQKVRRNLILGILSQTVTILLTFLNRQVFILGLGKEYLGINGLFANIVTVLSIAELGLTNTLLYLFYSPFLNKEYSKVNSLVFFSKKLFRIIALIILVFGIAIFPFLHLITDVTISMSKLYFYYTLYVLNSACTYIAVYKSLLIEVDQKNYVINIVKLFATVIQNVFQIVTIVLWKNYALYLLALFCGTLFNNILISLYANKKYQHIFSANRMQIDINEKKDIFKMIKSTILYKVGAVMVNNTDNILISILVSTVAVGMYSNYMMVVNVINTFISVGIRSVTAGLGEINATNDMNHSNKVFKNMVYIFHIVAIFCSVCLYWCIDDFIYLWIGQEYIIDGKSKFAIIFCFFIQHVIDPVWIYRETMGLFNEIKYLMLTTAVLNIAFSIGFGIWCGLPGIILATSLARICTTVWYEPYILYKKKFKKNAYEYYRLQIELLIQSIVCVAITYWGINNIVTSLIGMVFKVLICGIVVVSVFGIFNWKNHDIRKIFKILKSR